MRRVVLFVLGVWALYSEGLRRPKGCEAVGRGV